METLNGEKFYPAENDVVAADTDLLLKKLLNELELANDGITDGDEFAITVMEWVTKIERVLKGIDPMPETWKE